MVGQAATVAVEIPLNGLFSPHVLTHRRMHTTVLPPFWGLNSVHSLTPIVRVKNENVLGSPSDCSAPSDLALWQFGYLLGG